MRSTKLDVQPICKNCLEVVDAATDPFGEATPSEGDLSVCSKCRTIGQYDADMNIRPLMDFELETLRNEHPETYVDIQKIIFILKAIDNAKNNK